MKQLSVNKKQLTSKARINSEQTISSVLKLSLLVGGLFSVVGCSNIPYAIIDGSRSKITDVDSHNVMITGIDGRMYFDSDTVKNIEPGEHTIRLASTRINARGMLLSYKDIKLDAEPCKRYVVAAKHDKNKRFSNKHWEVKVLRVEDIPWCEIPEVYEAANSKS
ncbi:MAG: hypothetical protein OQJ89_05510 [Kangiellaceae bacterium]|nr:hypothetical protein [Kangiellaceae bacterium]